MRKLILATLLLGSALFASAQSGTNSPYSQYGLGVLSDQTSGFNRGMNGVGLGFHEHNQVNISTLPLMPRWILLPSSLMLESPDRLPTSMRME